MGRPGLSAHPKFRRLAVLLGRAYAARGILELLWESAYDALDDELGTSAEIAYVLGEPEADVEPIVTALQTCGFIDEIAPGLYRVHDLFDHCPEYVLLRCKAQGERLSARRSQARHWCIPALPGTESTEQRAAREPHPVENPVHAVENSRPPSVLLRVGFCERAQLPDDASETDFKENLKRAIAQARLPYDGEMINRVLDVVTRVKPLQAALGARRQRSRQTG